MVDIALDSSRAGLLLANTHARKLGLASKMLCIQGDAHTIPLASNCVDRITCRCGIMFFTNTGLVMSEMLRVLKPGGEVILVSRVGAEAGLRRAVEHWVSPAARKLGWRTEFSWDRYVRWAERTPEIEIVERRPMPPFGHFSLIRFTKKQQANGAFARSAAGKAK